MMLQGLGASTDIQGAIASLQAYGYCDQATYDQATCEAAAAALGTVCGWGFPDETSSAGIRPMTQCVVRQPSGLSYDQNVAAQFAAMHGYCDGKYFAPETCAAIGYPAAAPAPAPVVAPPPAPAPVYVPPPLVMTPAVVQVPTLQPLPPVATVDPSTGIITTQSPISYAPNPVAPTQTVTTTTAIPAAAATDFGAMLSNPVFGGIPLWGVLLAAGAGLMFMAGGR